MRLIDADKVIECLKSTYSREKDVINCIWVLNTLIDKVDEQPTVCDVDMVVAKLQETSDKAHDMILVSDDPQYYDGLDDGVRYAIELIKAGGNNVTIDSQKKQ